jgi:chaperonin GroEL
MKLYSREEELKASLIKGAEQIASIVSSTLGPNGCPVILKAKGEKPLITKDGVTVARFTTYEDPFENVAASIIKQASEETNTTCGDGTTTTTILASAIFKESQKYISLGISPYKLKREIDVVVEKIVTQIAELAKPIGSLKEIRDIARISANNDSKIGDLVADAIDQIGRDGAITIEEARSLETTLEIAEGYRFDSGYVAKDFITDTKNGLAKLDNPYILVTDESIDNIKSIAKILETVARDESSIVLIANDFGKEVLSTLLINHIRGTIKNVAIKAPRYGEERRAILEDIALATGSTFINKLAGLKVSAVELKDLGRAKSIEISSTETIIAEANGEQGKIEEQVEKLKSLIKQTNNMKEAERIQDRINQLSAAVGIIKVGGRTEVEVTEKKFRIEDALEAAKSAIEEGIVPGGGTTYLRAILDINDHSDVEYGYKIVYNAVMEPLKIMAARTKDTSERQIFNKLTNDDTSGYDFANEEFVDDMFEIGIVDPAKVLKYALRNAASAATTLLITNHAAIEE